MQSIPTEYKEILFRSRLEARWAKFFDLLGWKWQYEPFELNGWIPDFILFGKEEDVLVEVKPFSSIVEWKETCSKIRTAINNSTDIMKNKVINDVLLSGYCLIDDAGDPGVGYLIEKEFGTGAIAVMRGNPMGGYGFYSSCNSWHCRITGLYDGNAYAFLAGADEVKSLWNQSFVIGQWKPPEYEISVEDKIRAKGLRFIKHKNGKSYYYTINGFRLYAPNWKINGFNGDPSIEPDSLETALDYIKSGGKSK